MEQKNIYICCTYHHVLIAMIKAMNSPVPSDIILENLIPSCGELKYRLSKQNVFQNVFYFNRRRVPVFKSNSKIKKLLFEHKHYYEKMREQIKFQLGLDSFDYKEIYIFNDRCVWGYYFCSANIAYHLIEDAIDYFKYIERVNARSWVQQEVLAMVDPNSFKNKLKRILNYGFFLLGQSSNAKTIEVNECKDLFIPMDEKIIECPKTQLYDNLTEAQKGIICDVLLRDKAELLNIPDKSMLLLTQPLRIETSVPTKQAQIKLYGDIIADYKSRGYKVYIKPHPRDELDYEAIFQDDTVLEQFFPLEVIDFLPIHPFGVAITISSAGIYALESAKEKIVLGFDYTKAYADPDITIEESIMPAFSQKNVAIALSSSNDFAPYLSVLIQSIAQNSSAEFNYDILVLTRDINDYYKNALREIIKNKNNFSIRFIDMKLYALNKDFWQTKIIPMETWFRIYIPTIFSSYSKILYLDSDMLADADISELYNIDLQENYLGAVIDPAGVGAFNGPDPAMTRYFNEVLQLNDSEEYFQGGLLLMNLNKIREDFPLENLIEFSTSQPWRLFDQDVFNILFAGSVKFLPSEWNVTSYVNYRAPLIEMAPLELQRKYFEARKAPKIIHYPGRYKPWNMPTLDMATYFWKYARQSPLYEVILYRKIQSESPRRPKKTGKKFARILPVGSKRREFVKKNISFFL